MTPVSPSSHQIPPPSVINLYRWHQGWCREKRHDKNDLLSPGKGSTTTNPYAYMEFCETIVCSSVNNTISNNCWVSHMLPRFCRPACEHGAACGWSNIFRAAEFFFLFSNPECNDATLSFQTLPPTARDKWDSQKTGDRKIAAFILTAFWQTMHKTFLGKSVSLTICVEDVLLGKWCIRGVAK